MARVKRGFKARRRRNKILKMAKGFHFDRRNKFRMAKATVERAMAYMFKSRKFLKRDMRKLWILRINAGARMLGTSYSRLINKLKVNNIELNRKMLSEMASRDFNGFKALVESLN
ncbi:MAG: 50S ribosomal protein L20 [Bacteriovoracaceae bacterium]|nr:50S ribosomal protein L20 [Bacteriovoracaceae bacterium]